jgi:hypothetical protein
MIHDVIETPRARKMRIIAETAEQFGVSMEDVVGRSRRWVAVRARHTAMRKIEAAFPEMSEMQIGALFGGRDPSTVAYALGRAKARMARVATHCFDRPELDPAFIKARRDAVDRVVKEVAVKFGVPVQRIMGSDATHETLKARYEAIAKVHSIYPTIGKNELARLFNRQKCLSGYDMKAKAVAAE